MKPSKETIAAGAAWALGAIFVLAPALLVDHLAGPDLRAWEGVYAAGALGGLILELVQGKGRIELPGLSPRNTDTKDPRAPLGVQLDLGVFARIVSGAVAAPVFLIAYDKLVGNMNAKALASAGGALDTRALAVFVGFAAPAVWAAAGKLVDARLAVLTKNLASTALKDTHQQLRAAADRATQPGAATANALMFRPRELRTLLESAGKTAPSRFTLADAMTDATDLATPAEDLVARDAINQAIGATAALQKILDGG
jgi:hypothetical protein